MDKNTKISNTIRWVGVLPVAVVSGYLSMVAYYFLMKLSFGVGDIGEGEIIFTGFLLPFVKYGIGAYAFVYLGNLVAPSKIIAVPALLLVISIALSVYFVVTEHNKSNNLYAFYYSGAIFGGILAFLQTQKKD